LRQNTLSLFAGEHATATDAVDRALILNPNSGHACRIRGYALVRQNRPEPAIDAFQRAMRLSPLDPFLLPGSAASLAPEGPQTARLARYPASPRGSAD